MQGIDLCTAAVLIAQPSARVPRPTGVLITKSTPPVFNSSTIVFSPIGPDPSEFFRTLCANTPLFARKSAVPPVATNLNPSSAKARDGANPELLSLSAKDINTVPDLGSGPNALI